MIRRPNVRARCFQPNLQARWPGNQKFIKRSYRIYCRRCRWCRRPKSASHWAYPGICEGCGQYMIVFEAGDDSLDEFRLTRHEHEMRNSSLVRTGFGRYRNLGGAS